jgi:hypothetical protein
VIFTRKGLPYSVVGTLWRPVPLVGPTVAGSFTMFAIDTNGGDNSGLNTAPLTQIYANTDVGNNGAGAAYDTDVAAGGITYSYVNTVTPRGIAAVNCAPVAPPTSAGTLFYGK